VFLVVVAITYLLHRMSLSQIVASWKIAAGQIVAAGAALLFALPLVRVFINSGPTFNLSGLPSMPLTLAEGAASLAGPGWVGRLLQVRIGRAGPHNLTGEALPQANEGHTESGHAD
jgi:L-lactate permease